jgi:DNA mismatch repair protein MutL
LSKIRQLEPHVADLIAAGEVVERPASVIKELMENSIDAGAAALTVEIKNGGVIYMRVTDNGCGIAAEDTETAFLRHATSKLRDASGLEAISTLGFRGEALAAVAAVSKIELLTREAGAPEGTSLTVEGGVVRDKRAAGCPEGTTMIVRDLFYNTPARLKFMKTDKAEGAAVTAQVFSCALSHPEVSVRYIRDGKEECHTPGDGRMDSCIYSLFGREYARGLQKAASDDGAVSVTGYISAPAHARGNRSHQYFFVNGRFVRSKTLQAALEQAYRNSLFTGRYPTCVLYVNLSPSEVDVNVHPTKTEVKFVRESQVFSGVYYAALSALEGDAPTPEISLSGATKNIMSESVRPDLAGPPPRREPVSARPENDRGRAAAPERDFEGGFVSRAPSVPERTQYAPVRSLPRVPYETKKPGPAPQADYYEEAAAEIADMPAPRTYTVLGEALGTYILVEQEESLWLIDKHAAHERIHFDRLKAEKQVIMSQTLLEPVLCELGREDTALLLESGELFERLGFLIEPFGETALAVRQAPAAIEAADIAGTLGEMMRIVRRGGSPDSGMIFDELLHTVACKAAVKAGRRSEPPELEALVGRVLSGEIRYCPHGRPVAMELTKSALDRNFKRT